MSRFRLILTQGYTGIQANPIQNVFYYESPAGGTSATALAGAFDTTVLPKIADIQSTHLNYYAIDVLDLDDLNNFAYLVPTTQHGAWGVGVDPLPMFMAWSFKYHRATYASRHGWKRFAGLEEGMIDGNVPETSMIPFFNVLSATLGAHLPAFPFGWDPKIARRPPPGGDLSDTILFPVGSVSYYSITTQNTRKR